MEGKLAVLQNLRTSFGMKILRKLSSSSLRAFSKLDSYKTGFSLPRSLPFSTGAVSEAVDKPKNVNNGDIGAFPYRVDTYENLFKDALANPEDFWAEQAEKLVWFKKWNRVLDNDNPPFTKWFGGGQLNTCYNALDRHVENGAGNRIALIHDSPVTLSQSSYTYHQLLDEVQKFANVLRAQGVAKGDRVLLYLPMIPQAIIAMLACARIGAIHIIVFGGFAAKELSVRIGHSEPKVIVSASVGIEPGKVLEYKPILDEAIELASSKPKNCIIYQRENTPTALLQKGRDLDWNMEMDKASTTAPCEPIEAMDPLYIIHTSGTTGLPKGIVRPSAGHAVVLPWTMQTIYGIKPGEVWWAASDLGWVVGHSYICYAPLLYGCTSIMYEGKPVGTPDAGQFFRVAAEHNVASFFCAPTALRGIRQADPKGHQGAHYQMKNLRYIFSAGEHLDFDTRYWAEKNFSVPVLDHWWQTESGYPICAPCLGCPDANLNPPKDVAGRPLPGWDLAILNEKGEEIVGDGLGRIVVRLPLPPGSLSTFWKNDQKFKETYFKEFPGYYDTQDAGSHTPVGAYIMSRVDDVINVAGHRISGGALEQAILHHQAVVDCAVVGVDDELKGTIPVAVCVLNDDFKGGSTQIKKEIVQRVRKDVGPVAALKTVIVVPKLPKTRSGKIARNTIAAMANNRPFKIPVTIEDASVYPQIKERLQEVGLALEAPEPEMPNAEDQGVRKVTV